MSNSIASSSTSYGLTTVAELSQKNFSKLDTNSDGKLSATELSAVAKGAQGRTAAAALLKQMDTNGDKYISQSELNSATTKTANQNALKYYSKLDANGDGKLNASELAAVTKNGRQGLVDAAKLLKELDANGDKSVSKAEFLSATTQDSSGTTSAKTATERYKESFKKFDTNGDGKLRASELAAMAKSGSKIGISADTNGDKVVSEAEYAVAAAKLDATSGDTGSSSSTSVTKSPLLTKLLSAIKSSSTTSESSGTASQKMLAAIDSDGNGSLSKEEVQLYMAKIRQQSTQNSLYSADGTSSASSTDPLLDMQL